MKNIFIKISFAITSTLLVMSSVSALTISPARAELVGSPGETIEQVVTITGSLDVDTTYEVSVESFDLQESASSTSIKKSLASWIKIKDTVTIKKGEKVNLPYSVSIPNSADIYNNNSIIYFSDMSTKSGGAKSAMLINLKINGLVPVVCTLLTKQLARGQDNNEVLALQKFLFGSGYLTTKPNGFFDTGTVTAVKRFQVANGVSPLGTVGAVTRLKVMNLSCKGTDISNYRQKVVKDTEDKKMSSYKLEYFNKVIRLYPYSKSETTSWMSSCMNSVFAGRAKSLDESYVLTKDETDLFSKCLKTFASTAKQSYSLEYLKNLVEDNYPNQKNKKDKLSGCMNTVFGSRATSIDDTYIFTSEEYKKFASCFDSK